MGGGKASFDRVDDDAFGDERWIDGSVVRWTVVTVAYVLLFGGVVYGYRTGDGDALSVGGHEIPMLDWITLLSVVVLGVVVLPAAFGNPRDTVSMLGSFVRDRVAALALACLVFLAAAAAVGPTIVDRPEVAPLAIYQPPVGFSVAEYVPVSCLGTVADGRCHGTLEHPFGTDEGGRDLLASTVYGLRTSLQVGLSAAVVTGGIGATAGVVAGTFGGRVDAALVRYVDVQSAVPAFFVYVLLVAMLSPDLVLLVVVFGALSWGGIARLVRSEVIRIRGEPYVRAAAAAGGGRLYVLRRHVLPNATTAVFVPITTLVPQYILYEAALSFLGFGDSDPRLPSLGSEIEDGLTHQFATWWEIWWQALVPAAVLTWLVLSILLVGDRLEDVVDPRRT